LPAIGLQLYTVRQDAETDLFGTLAAVAGMGYAGVEFAGVPNHPAPVVADALRDLGLVAAGVVVPMNSLNDPATFKSARDYNHRIGSPTILFPWLDEQYRVDAEAFRRTADLLNSFGALCRADGLRFLYHIHGYEFSRHAGSTGLEILMERFDPALVQLEIDTYWVEHAGASALEIYSRYADLCPYIHFKDMNNRDEKRDIEVGDGIVDTAGIIRAAHGHAVEWFIVEQERFDRPPLESAAISYRNIERLVRQNTV
jgi:sugar phosphate isomerase/epimerase